MESYGIHWFRRDLRLQGNLALDWSFQRHKGRVLGVFCFDSNFLSRDDFSVNRFAFFLETLDTLKQELQARGGDLKVIDCMPGRAFDQLLQILRQNQKVLPSTVSWSRDYEPFARQRDQKMEVLLTQKWGIQVQTERDHLLLEPWEVLKDSASSSSSYYQVYTPFSKRWFEAFHSPKIQERMDSQNQALSSSQRFALSWKDLLGAELNCHDLLKDALSEMKRKTHAQVSISIPKAGHSEAIRVLKEFKNKLESYSSDRDIPSIEGTSRLSMFLKNGSLSVSQIIRELDLSQAKFKSDSGETRFLKELVWREFYYSILYHCPRVEKEAFIERYNDIVWENRDDYFEAWKEGKTGYPIVDAGMRQLKQTGWMHNRVRMIVASFLTKDLLVSWQWGENYFMKALLDGDLAPNNGGWQWAASTGCDPQPYFRIFNPTLQGKKFDPEGVYVRHWLPELKHVSDQKIHEPRNPIVVHEERRIKAMALYKK